MGTQIDLAAGLDSQEDGVTKTQVNNTAAQTVKSPYWMLIFVSILFFIVG